ncbi:flagellar basal body P-ring formation chaperone FlgA [Sagittula salina]|uniref:Flagella basal body P-ring formation protein FlgA n=1 Tax=Sagittula salina TaxID=2820268 RepID=A0A940MSS3_9RHOB|nr:flagellar basal body P-ring formation chaperone FlgA [Sagittula salina]MBP0483342.1 flagellar basal body P-ring formation protein FlgA [Sagittula salina]
MRLALLLIGCAVPALADTVVATRPLRPQQIITAEAVQLDGAVVPGAYTALDQVIGQEAQYAVYPGRPLMIGAVGEPALIDRNQLVELVYTHGGLRIITEGRALGRGAAGDRIRVMNTSSRTAVFGTISENGTILVAK